MKSAVIRFCKGLFVGASMMLPGVSGGTMAILLGIYDALIHAISTFRSDIKKNAIFLGEFVAGALVGIALLSKGILYVVETYEMPMMFLFLGAIIGSLPTLIQKAGKQGKIKPVHWLFAVIGFALVMGLARLPEGLFVFSQTFSLFHFVMLLIAGFIIAVALVLPGISASYMLLVLGMYDLTLRAINEVNVLFLLPLVIGVLAGTFMTTGVLERAMQKKPGPTYMLIIGFVVGSIMQVFPGLPQGGEIPICIVTLLAGAGVILLLSRYAQE